MTIEEFLLKYAPIIGPFSGVFAAFLLQRGTDEIIKLNKRRYYLVSLGKELAQSRDDLNVPISIDSTILPLQLNVWRSLLSSGSLPILKYNEASLLISLYNNISRYNNIVANSNSRRDLIRKEQNPIQDPLYIKLSSAYNYKDLDKQEEYENALKSTLNSQSIQEDIILDLVRAYRNKLIDILNILLEQEWIKKGGVYCVIFPYYIKDQEETSLISLINESREELIYENDLSTYLINRS